MLLLINIARSKAMEMVIVVRILVFLTAVDFLRLFCYN